MTKKFRFTYQNPDEEQEIWYLNGKYLLSVCHDEHGWAGMEAVSDAIKTIATEIGASIEEEEYNG